MAKGCENYDLGVLMMKDPQSMNEHESLRKDSRHAFKVESLIKIIQKWDKRYRNENTEETSSIPK